MAVAERDQLECMVQFEYNSAAQHSTAQHSTAQPLAWVVVVRDQCSVLVAEASAVFVVCAGDRPSCTVSMCSFF